MRIVIIGAGEVGFHVAKSLSELDYDITVVDTNHKKCQRANEHLDVIVIKGNGSDEKVLEQANVADADYVFTLTDSDETNLISSMQAHNLGAKKIIARLRDFDYSKNGHSVIPEKFGIDMVIHPEAAVAQEIQVEVVASETDMMEATITTTTSEDGTVKTEVNKIKGKEAEVEATIAAIEDVKLHVEH